MWTDAYRTEPPRERKPKKVRELLELLQRLRAVDPRIHDITFRPTTRRERCVYPPRGIRVIYSGVDVPLSGTPERRALATRLSRAANNIAVQIVAVENPRNGWTP